MIGTVSRPFHRPFMIGSLFMFPSPSTARIGSHRLEVRGVDVILFSH